MKKSKTLWMGFTAMGLIFSGCGRLSEGVIQEIEFPTHEPRLAVTMLCNWDSDTLVARAQSSAGILDTLGSQKQKEALFTLSQAGGTAITWGGTANWENGLGHVLVNPGLEDGIWTLTAEAPNFETAVATQSTPPRLDTLVGSSNRVTYEIMAEEPTVEEYSDDKVYVEQTVEIELNLPNRPQDADFFFVRPTLLSSNLDDDEYASIEINREFDQDPRLESLSIIEGLLIQEVAGTTGLESIQITLSIDYYGGTVEGYDALIPSLEVVAMTSEMATYYTSIEENLSSGFSLFSEPLLVYTNVSSGFGCFGIYRSLMLPL